MTRNCYIYTILAFCLATLMPACTSEELLADGETGSRDIVFRAAAHHSNKWTLITRNDPDPDPDPTQPANT